MAAIQSPQSYEQKVIDSVSPPSPILQDTNIGYCGLALCTQIHRHRSTCIIYYKIIIKNTNMLQVIMLNDKIYSPIYIFSVLQV